MESLRQQNEFRLLYETHYNNLCRAAFHVIREREAAREVVQQVFTELWSRQNWRELQSPKAYLYVAVYNRSLNFIQSHKRFLPEEAIPDVAADSSPLEVDELRLTIARAIDALPDKCKEIFLLSREEQMSYSEIAKHLNLSIKTVERQMGIALAKLRDYLQRYS